MEGKVDGFIVIIVGGVVGWVRCYFYEGFCVFAVDVGFLHCLSVFFVLHS